MAKGQDLGKKFIDEGHQKKVGFCFPKMLQRRWGKIKIYDHMEIPLIIVEARFGILGLVVFKVLVHLQKIKIQHELLVFSTSFHNFFFFFFGENLFSQCLPSQDSNIMLLGENS